MRNLIHVLIFSIVVLIAGCSGSDAYQGTWKATDLNGNKFIINFEPKKFSIKDESGKVSTFEYSQHSIKIENSVKSYGIELDDGRSYNIIFPVPNDLRKGIITLSTNAPEYTISRDSNLEFNDLGKLQ